ncbi:TetR/AcrR family transcriptional regulator [Kocuria sp.]|uniref:TetR/AcrR family transcriptional regulator n=1 Tax=Kocuria sp. TaxID=1871328 RepID=UPI0026E0EE72|nr:TetR/AcrR family transcriptional regulator [Kocuria sp.]MDO5618165.1 TetR/AcrR family transcriptional regulator [Kocuria sp.]
MPPRTPARERILSAAARCFYAHGIAATGIDTVIAEAGVAKMSLYNNFANKSALVEGYIDARHQEWMDLHRLRAADAHSPQERVLAVFDAYLDHAQGAYQNGFRGCGLLNAAGELPVGDPARAAVARHKAEVQAIVITALRELVDETSATQLTEHLAFLLEGSMSLAGLEGSPDRILHARTLAQALLNGLQR